MKGLSITGVQQHVDFEDMIQRTALVVTRPVDGRSILLPVEEDEVMMLIAFASDEEVDEEEHQSVSVGSPVSDEVEPGFQL